MHVEIKLLLYFYLFRCAFFFFSLSFRWRRAKCVFPKICSIYTVVGGEGGASLDFSGLGDDCLQSEQTVLFLLFFGFSFSNYARALHSRNEPSAPEACACRTLRSRDHHSTHTKIECTAKRKNDNNGKMSEPHERECMSVRCLHCYKDVQQSVTNDVERIVLLRLLFRLH